MANFCANCGANPGDSAKFCPGCGTQTVAAGAQQVYQPQYMPPAPAPKKKIKALPVLLGGAALLVVLVTAIAVAGKKSGGDAGKEDKPPAPGPKDGDAVWDGGELELYPAYISVPDGCSLYLDWNTAMPNAEIVWNSSNTAVATVDADGLITAVSFGEAVITASLKGKPEVKEKCGIFVKNYLEAENALNDILIWEDGPPSLYYRAETIGMDNMSAGVTPTFGYEPGENIPVCLSPDAEIITEVSASFTKPKASVALLAAGSRPKPKIIWIKKAKIKDRLKDKTEWMILVIDEHEEYDILGNYIRNEMFDMIATKKGGDTPVGTYNGTAKYIAHNDYAPHFAKYPDHSRCHWCERVVVDEKYEGGIWKGSPTSENDEPLEWLTNESYSWKGYYTSKDNPGTLFEIKKSEMKTDHTYSSERIKIPDFKTTREMSEWVGENYTAPSLWFAVRAEVYNNYTHVVHQPTSKGNNWGYTRTYENDPEQTITLRINIYTDNTVKVRKEEFTGTIVKWLG